MKELIQSILLIASITLISGCNVNRASLPNTKPVIDDNLPVVDAGTLKTIPDLNSIALEWKTIPEPEVKGYYIYRAKLADDGQRLTRIGSVESRYASHYLDTNLEPDVQYMYAVSVMGSRNKESSPSQTVNVSTKIRFPSVSFITAVSNLPRQIKILWRPHTNPRVSHYILERSDQKTSKWRKIATIKPRLIVEYIDTDIGDNVEYSYRIKSVTFDDVVSLPSQSAMATTRPLPDGLNSLEATTTLPRKIQLTWTPPTQKDLMNCNIYSSNSQGGTYSLISKAKLTDNTFNDEINQDGKSRYYKITTVDKAELESTLAISPTMGSTLNIPATPIINLAMIEGTKAVLNWKAGDTRAVSYNIHKTIKEGFFSKKSEIIPNITENRFEDKDIIRGVTYKYQIEAVDEFGLVSKKTEATSLTIPKSEEKQKNATSTN